jgi:hypothetical protein
MIKKNYTIVIDFNTMGKQHKNKWWDIQKREFLNVYFTKIEKHVLSHVLN